MNTYLELAIARVRLNEAKAKAAHPDDALAAYCVSSTANEFAFREMATVLDGIQRDINNFRKDLNNIELDAQLCRNYGRLFVTWVQNELDSAKNYITRA